jgi:hypothetical protein
LLILLLAGALHLGFAGRGCKDLVREWWARLGGYMMLLTLAWLLLAGSCAFGPLLVRWVIAKLQWGSIVPAGLWVAHNYLGVKAASSAKTSGKVEKIASADTSGGRWIVRLFKSPKVLDAIARLAPYVFGMGLVLLLATAVHIGAGSFFPPGQTAKLWHSMPEATPGARLGCLVRSLLENPMGGIVSTIAGRRHNSRDRVALVIPSPGRK